MKNIIKSSISIILISSMLLSTSLVVFAEPIAQEHESYIGQMQIQYIQEDEYDITFYQEGNIRTAIVNENGTQSIIQINDITGELTLNGQSVKDNILSIKEPNISTYSNWGSPSTTITSLSYVSWGVGAIAGALMLKYPQMLSSKAQYIAGLVVSTGGLLYVKAVSRYNYVDYAPKVGYRLTESLHTDSKCQTAALYSQTMSGSR